MPAIPVPRFASCAPWWTSSRATRTLARRSASTRTAASSIFHEFKYHPKERITGTQDRVYEHLGSLFWTVEIWAPNKEAGITDCKWIDWYREHPVEDDLKLLKWSDEQCGGQVHVDWKPFRHPQLGVVEWVVKGPPGVAIALAATADRAGTLRTEVTLD